MLVTFPALATRWTVQLTRSKHMADIIGLCPETGRMINSGCVPAGTSRHACPLRQGRRGSTGGRAHPSVSVVSSSLSLCST